VREGQIQQLTRDHSLVSDILAAMPDLPEEQRAELPKNVVTRALGVGDNVNVDVGSFEVAEGDVYVLCSDGLSGMVADDEILQIVTTSPEPKLACLRLVNAANDHGGEDNVTVLVARVGTAAEGAARTQDTLVPPPPDSRSGAAL
jgi:protein phosphatase